MSLSETEKAYIAGLIDGEGCFYISSAQKRYFQMKLIIAGTVHEHMRAVYEMTGCTGSLHFVSKKPPRADQTQWHMASNAALGLIKSIMPYLILKKDQAQLVRLFQEHKNNSPPYNNRHPISEAVLDYRQSMMDILKEMKKNGKTFNEVDVELIEMFPQEHTQLPLIS